ncbi:glycosyltransferase family 2 protein [bacterium]|nr:glycosyltransferase family 2 protein [bacterium]
MLNGKRITVVLPAYNAARTLEKTYSEIPRDIIDDVILVDDASHDETFSVAKRLGIPAFRHPINRGYGGNQKTCYTEALRRNAEIVIMLHPDYQYSPKLLVAMAGMIAYGEYDAIIASRILGKGALRGGMPLYKYFFNRCLTFAQNVLMSQKFSEYHTGYRAFRREVLAELPLLENSDDFVFDNEMLAQSLYFGFKVGEISCPTLYAPESSSINFSRSVTYGLGVLGVSWKYFLAKQGFASYELFSREGKRLSLDPATDNLSNRSSSVTIQ